MASRFATRLQSTSKRDETSAMKIAFVVAEFNSEVTFPMEERARRHAESLGVEVARVVRVPGVYDMAPVVKRFTISLAGSTSSIGTGLRPSSSADLSRNRPRMVRRRSDCSLLTLA